MTDPIKSANFPPPLYSFNYSRIHHISNLLIIAEICLNNCRIDIYTKSKLVYIYCTKNKIVHIFFYLSCFLGAFSTVCRSRSSGWLLINNVNDYILRVTICQFSQRVHLCLIVQSTGKKNWNKKGKIYPNGSVQKVKGISPEQMRGFKGAWPIALSSSKVLQRDNHKWSIHRYNIMHAVKTFAVITSSSFNWGRGEEGGNGVLSLSENAAISYVFLIKNELMWVPL